MSVCTSYIFRLSMLSTWPPSLKVTVVDFEVHFKHFRTLCVVPWSVKFCRPLPLTGRHHWIVSCRKIHLKFLTFFHCSTNICLGTFICCEQHRGVLNKFTYRIVGSRRQGRRLKQLLDNLKQKRRYWNFKEEALGSAVWKTGFEGNHLTFERRDTHMNESIIV